MKKVSLSFSLPCFFFGVKGNIINHKQKSYTPCVLRRRQLEVEEGKQLNISREEKNIKNGNHR